MTKRNKDSRDDFEAWQIAEIKAGLAELDRGEFLTEAKASALMNAFKKSKAKGRESE